MTCRERSPKNIETSVKTKQDTDDVYFSLEKLNALLQKERSNAKMLCSRIEEQSKLIGIQKREILQYQDLKQNNAKLMSRQADECMKSKQLEQRFMDLAANHKEMINFKDEYKKQNAELINENKRLQEENEKLFSKELQKKDETIQKLTQELRDLTTKCKLSKKENQDKTRQFQLKIQELMVREAALKENLHNSQKQLKDAVEMSKELDLKLRQTQDTNRIREAEENEKLEALIKEKDKLLDLSIKRGKVIQEKQEKIQEIERKRREAENARQVAEERFKRAAATVNAELKVKELQHDLQKALELYKNLQKEFEAYKKHSSDLLAQEKELNTKLRHMIS